MLTVRVFGGGGGGYCHCNVILSRIVQGGCTLITHLRVISDFQFQIVYIFWDYIVTNVRVV